MTKLKITNDQIVNGTLPPNLSLEGIEELDLSYCINLETAPNLPVGIKKINLSECKKLEIIPPIPEGVEDLNLSGCNNLKTAPNLSAGIKKINLSCCFKLKTIPKILDGVEELNLYRCEYLEIAPNLPAGIRKINLSHCKKLKTLPQIPDGVEELDLSCCENLETAPNLPTGIKKINLSECKKLEIIPPIPEGIEELNLSGCENLETAPNLPAGIKKIYLSWCKKLKTLPPIPDMVEELDLSGCKNLEISPNFPAGIKKIYLSWCNKLKTIPQIPDGVEVLDLSYCSNLETVPNLPTGIKKINFLGCQTLKTMPHIPEGVEELNLSHCDKLETVPNLPAGIKKINFSDCYKLIPTPELVRRLSELEESGCEVQYPRHFNLSNQSALAKIRLSEIGKRYKETNNLDAENPISSTTVLLHRFLNEGVNQRGNIKEIVKAVDPVLNILDKNPQHLKWVEETSALFLNGCVNQPVAGWSEICAFASIAEAPTMVEKMQSVKHLLVNDQIKDFVAATYKGGKAVEVEAGNSLLREIHKKLLQEKDIEKPWLGVPGPVAYEGSIRTWLTTERIQEFYDQIKIPILEKTPLELAEFLCEGVHGKMWGEITFPQEIAEVHKIYKEKVESIWPKIEEMSDEDKEKDEFIEGFDDLRKQSELDQHQATLKTIQQLTTDTLNLELQKKCALESDLANTSNHVAASLVLPLMMDKERVRDKMEDCR